VAGVKIDPDAVARYAKTMAKGADRLDGSAKSLKGETLGVEAFGELGRQVRTAEAYSRAANTLRDQLARAIETLHAASDTLEKVAEQYKAGDQDTVKTITRAENR
jgi:ABC-type transporter Mla subunit MlaD